MQLVNAQTAANSLTSKDSITLRIAQEAKVFIQSKTAVGIFVGLYRDGRIYTYNDGSVCKDVN
ncbi:hypothetical protein Dfri01_21190 [Dyadobacter frigoris]|nr:hypothetical protein Dfri01_21190 [Dyadobacter frigoris]